MKKQFVSILLAVFVLFAATVACNETTPTPEPVAVDAVTATQLWNAVDPTQATKVCTLGLFVPAEGMGACESLVLSCKLSVATGQSLPDACRYAAQPMVDAINEMKAQGK